MCAPPPFPPSLQQRGINLCGKGAGGETICGAADKGEDNACRQVVIARSCQQRCVNCPE